MKDYLAQVEKASEGRSWVRSHTGPGNGPRKARTVWPARQSSHASRGSSWRGAAAPKDGDL